ncbi:MAG: class II aldolase/adducin family protein [bacterium]
MLDIQTIVSLSLEYGRNPRWVIAGGGNTSVKTDERLAIKASGRALGQITADDFVEIDRTALAPLFTSPYPEDPHEREAQALADLMNSRVAGQGTLRPSVETLMHDVFPQTYVVHTHPTLVNGLTCSQDAEARAQALFGEELIWIDDVNPGYVLGTVVSELVGAFIASKERNPWLMLLRNHGLVVAGDTPEEIRRRNAFVVQTIWDSLEQLPAGEAHEGRPAWYDTSARAVASGPDTHADNASIQGAEREIRTVFADFGEADIHVSAHCDDNFLALSGDPEDMFARLSESFSPDHLVYAARQPAMVDMPAAPGKTPSTAEAAASSGHADVGNTTSKGEGSANGQTPDPDAVRRAITAYREKWQSLPRVVVIPGVGAFGTDASGAIADAAGRLCLDALLISRYAENFGGYRFMPPEQIEFIRSWEVERFRQKQASGES